MQSSGLYTSCLFSIYLNDETVDIEKPDRIYPLTFVVYDFPGLFYIHPFFYQRYKICINNKWCFIKFLVLLIVFYYN